MSDAKLVRREDLVVALDYGQFYLHTLDNDPELAVAVLEQAQEADGIAQADGLLVVESPHQNNLAMPLAIEMWDGEPRADLDEWQEAFQAHVEVTEQFVYESPTADLTEIEVPPGSYDILITGRGFVSHGWPGSTEPGDEWRIRLWPATTPRPARRLRSFVDPVSEVLDEARADEAPGGDEQGRELRRTRALAAGQRIKADLDRAASARALSGLLGDAVIHAVVPGKIARYWFLAAHLDVAGMLGQGDPEVGAQFTMHGSSYRDEDDEDPITGSNGEIRCVWTVLDDPTRVAMTWRWFGPEGWVLLTGEEQYRRLWARETIPRRVPRLDQPSTLAIEFTDATTASGSPMTAIHLIHGDVPADWIEDLSDFWISKIDLWVWQVAHAPNWRGRRR